MTDDGFFSDRYLQRYVASVPWTAFVETGTEEGKTARWVAQLGKPVFTCETDRKYVEMNEFGLPANVKFYEMDSPDFISAIRLLVGSLPLFFLDAHWGTYWPLLDELKSLSMNYYGAVIIVHDCTVPGRPNFWTCKGGGKDNEGPENNWTYIKQGLDFRNQYRLYYPIYGDQTPGWLVLFQNCNPVGALEYLKEESVFE